MAEQTKPQAEDTQPRAEKPAENAPKPQKEYGGPKGPDPVRYGDWERNGKCVDF